jgi:hypothetical protein
MTFNVPYPRETSQLLPSSYYLEFPYLSSARQSQGVDTQESQDYPLPATLVRNPELFERYDFVADVDIFRIYSPRPECRRKLHLDTTEDLGMP